MINFSGVDSFIPMTRVIDGGEPVEFKCLFKSWRERDQSVGLAGKRKSSSKLELFD